MTQLAPPLTDRNETPLERTDRHLAELMQEARVAQTGVQVLLVRRQLLFADLGVTERADAA
jgi:Family of unknown function (DUF6328)